MRMRMKEEARAAILDAAEQVLAEQGQAARMDDIAARVGLSQMHVSRLLTKALAKLRRQLGE